MCSEEEAFKHSVECITGPISRIISTQGMPAVYQSLDAEGKKIFEKVQSFQLISTKPKKSCGTSSMGAQSW